jgi:hypothetical protein|tara:strand:+ start:746 stop:1522 length:777 start_codon:yes stop_codon:yes gene_type:complete
MAENPKFGNENLGGSEIPFGSSTNTSPKTNNYDPSATRRGTLPLGAIPANDLNFVNADWGSQTDLDWRVRLSLPANFQNSEVMAPLLETDGFMFPFTPQITMEHTANYNALHPTHSNYPFPAYQNSQVNALTIVGEFFVETAEDAKYWIAATHYLRSVTKMAYGATSNQGSPPPIVKLNGYGDYVFNDVPVTVTYFTVDLPSDVDYIQTDVGPNGTWVPVKSNINIQVQPTYSRKNITKFSLDTFISGGYIASGKGFI